MAKKSQELKALLNNPEHYDIERDWLTFNTKGQNYENRRIYQKAFR